MRIAQIENNRRLGLYFDPRYGFGHEILARHFEIVVRLEIQLELRAVTCAAGSLNDRSNRDRCFQLVCRGRLYLDVYPKHLAARAFSDTRQRHLRR
jgi:hypothetical protein